MGPQSVWAAIRDLPVTRIGHGVRSAEDPRLLDELARRGTVLEVCPAATSRSASTPIGPPIRCIG